MKVVYIAETGQKGKKPTRKEELMQAAELVALQSRNSLI
jgi:hypothetical protein